MHTDRWLARGRTHEVCQDYALASGSLAVLSDGCSSSPHTDWGARLLCRAAVELGTGEGAAERADAWRRGLGLPAASLDGTLLVARVVDDRVEVRAWGDGAVAARRRDTGRWEVTLVEYAHSAPAYPSYLVDAERMAVFLAETAAARSFTRRVDGEVTVEHREGFPVGGDVWSLPTPEYDVVALLSDGVASFRRREGRIVVDVPAVDAVGRLLDLRGTQGRFVARPVRWFLHRTCPAAGWHHDDDLAVVGLEVSP